jgi:hypothetical protein
MKKVVILLIAAIALFSFSCNKYCYCKLYVDGVQDKDYKGEFVKESGKSCAEFSTKYEEAGIPYETKCK